MKALLSPSVLRNFGALLVLQAGTYLLPLLLIPYLVRTLGLEIFGTWMFAMAFVIIARICVNYGFDLTATRQVAAMRPEDRSHLSELLVDVVATRLLVCGACLTVLIVLSLLVAQVADIRLLLLAASLILGGEALFPVWLFQGLEKMGVVTQLRLGAKVVNLVLVVLLVKRPDDVLFVPLIEAATVILSSIAALILAHRHFGIRVARPRLVRIRAQLHDGRAIFIANLAVQFYTTINMIVLGFIIGPVAVGAYSIAEKIYSVLRGLLGPFVQATFPALTRMHDHSQADFAKIYRVMLQGLVILLSAVGVMLFLAATPLIWLVAGDTDAAAIDTLRVFAIAFPFALGSFLAPMLVVRKRNAALMRITLIGGFIGLLLAPALSWLYGAAGAAGAVFVVQIYNSIALLRANRVRA
jgi:O-antigen/teichoic acid export membrane protein